MAKRFFYVCAGILCLAFAYHLGARNATAQGQTTGSIKMIEAWGSYVAVVDASDDIYIVDPQKLRDVAKGNGWWKFNLNAVK